MHVLSMHYPNSALIDMNRYLYSLVQRPLDVADDSDEPQLLDRTVATQILRLFTNLVELGGENRLVTGVEVENLVNSIMPDMLLLVHGTENGVQAPRDARLNYETLLDNMRHASVSYTVCLYLVFTVIFITVFYLVFRISICPELSISHMKILAWLEMVSALLLLTAVLVTLAIRLVCSS